MTGPKKGHSNQEFFTSFEFKGMVDIGKNIHYDFRTSKSEKDENSMLRVLSYNIEMGMDLQGIIDDLKKQNADILLLQELDAGTKRIGMFDSGVEIAQALGLNYFFTCRKHIDGGYEGNGVLTKFDFDKRSLGHIHFNCYHGKRKHPKGHFCPAPIIIIGKTRVKVTSLHLDPFRCGKIGRMKQLTEVINLINQNRKSVDDEEMDETSSSNMNEPENYDFAIIGGDFNTACTGLARLMYPKLSVDYASVFGSIFRMSEAQELDKRVVKNSGFFDPFEKGSFGFGYDEDCTIRMGKLFTVKLDWLLLQKKKFRVIEKDIVPGVSDHMCVVVDLMLLKNEEEEDEGEGEDDDEMDLDEDKIKEKDD